jgi:hypothetical protein
MSLVVFFVLLFGNSLYSFILLSLKFSSLNEEQESVSYYGPWLVLRPSEHLDIDRRDRAGLMKTEFDGAIVSIFS